MPFPSLGLKFRSCGNLILTSVSPWQQISVIRRCRGICKRFIIMTSHHVCLFPAVEEKLSWHMNTLNIPETDDIICPSFSWCVFQFTQNAGLWLDGWCWTVIGRVVMWWIKEILKSLMEKRMLGRRVSTAGCRWSCCGLSVFGRWTKSSSDVQLKWLRSAEDPWETSTDGYTSHSAVMGLCVKEDFA